MDFHPTDGSAGRSVYLIFSSLRHLLFTTDSSPDSVSSIRTAVEFRFNAASGVSYRIEASSDLTQWEVIEASIIGQGGEVTRFYSTENSPARYFRVRRN